MKPYVSRLATSSAIQGSKEGPRDFAATAARNWHHAGGIGMGWGLVPVFCFLLHLIALNSYKWMIMIYIYIYMHMFGQNSSILVSDMVWLQMAQNDETIPVDGARFFKLPLFLTQ